MLLIETEATDRKVLQSLKKMMANRCPTWPELARRAGLSYYEVRESLQRLNRLGLVSWNPYKQRSFVLMNSNNKELTK